MTVRSFKATDNNAVILTATVASLNQVLWSCLYSGYEGRLSAGWAIPYNDTYFVTVYQNGDGSQQRYFRVDDNRGSTPYLAALYGYETMSDINTGVGKFPSDLQIVSPNFSNILKSNSGTTSPRNWCIWADQKICYLLINPESNNTFENACLVVFGDFVTYNPSDVYNSLIISRIVNSGSSSYNTLGGLHCPITSVLSGHYALRSYTQFGGSAPLGKHGDYYKRGVQFINPLDDSIVMSRMYITENKVLRGHLPGLWFLAADASNFNHGDTFNGTGTLTGKSFEVFKLQDSCFAIETSNTWYA